MSLDQSPSPVPCAVRHGFREVRLGDFIRAAQVGNCAGDAQHAVKAAPAQAKLLRGSADKVFLPDLEMRVLPQGSSANRLATRSKPCTPRPYR